MDLEKRIRMAAESILENESIREGLDDYGASALLKWGIACAERIASETNELDDDEEAEEITYPRMRALRQMLDNVKSLYRPELDPTDGRTLLAEISEFAAVVYGPAVELPRHLYWNVFTATLEGNAGEKINQLRALLEKNINLQGD
jgi:hypothetical protein